MADLVPRDHLIENLVRSSEAIPPAVVAVIEVLQLLCAEREPKAMADVLLAAEKYAGADLPSLRKLVRLIMRPFSAAAHYPLPRFHASLLELATSFREDEKAVRRILTAHRHVDSLVTQQQLLLQQQQQQQQQQNGVQEVHDDMCQPSLQHSSQPPVQQRGQAPAQELVQSPLERHEPNGVLQQQQQQHDGSDEDSQQLEQQPLLNGGWQQVDGEMHQSSGYLHPPAQNLHVPNGGFRDGEVANGEVANGYMDMGNGEMHQQALPSSHPMSHSLFLSFLSQLGLLARTAVEACENHLSFNRQLSYILQQPLLLPAAAASVLQEEALASVHSALAQRERRVDTTWKSLCMLQGQVEREVGRLQQTVKLLALEELAARAKADAEAARRRERGEEEGERKEWWGWWKWLGVFCKRPLVTVLTLVGIPVVLYSLRGLRGLRGLLQLLLRPIGAACCGVGAAPGDGVDVGGDTGGVV